MTDSELTAYLDQYRHIWPTDASFFTWLRGNLRGSIWNHNPVKLDFKKSQVRKPPLDYAGRAKGIIKCQLSGKWIAASNAQVDHVEGNVSLRCVDDILPFVLHMACPQELQCVSPEAHKIKSYAEKMGISYEEAALAKKAIEIEGQDWRAFLEENGIASKNVKAKDRRKEIIAVLSKK